VPWSLSTHPEFSRLTIRHHPDQHLFQDLLDHLSLQYDLDPFGSPLRRDHCRLEPTLPFPHRQAIQPAMPRMQTSLHLFDHFENIQVAHLSDPTGSAFAPGPESDAPPPQAVSILFSPTSASSVRDSPTLNSPQLLIFSGSMVSLKPGHQS